MKTLVTGFDGTEQGRDALALSAVFAHALKAELVVAVVDETRPFMGRGPAASETAAGLAETLEMAAEQLSGIDFDGRTTWGSVPECLELIASDASADALIVGSTHRGELGKVFPGSVGDRLLAGAPCAVAIAPNGYAEREIPQLLRIGVGIDGEEESLAALELANDTAVTVGGSLRLITAVPPVVDLLPGRIATNSPAYARLVREQLAGELKRASATSSSEIEVVETLIDGNPETVLREQSLDLDLLVLGSRGYGPLQRVFLGGVASKVIRDAACPVLITPRSASHSHPRARDTLASTVF